MSSRATNSRPRQGSWPFPFDPRSLATRARLWIPIAIEALWLLTVGLVPIVFAPPDFMLFTDVPKVVLLRMFTGLTGLLLVLEWSLKPQAQHQSDNLSSTTRFLNWLRENPAHWILVAAAMFLAANVISTLLSESISVSMWGSHPGRDGYGLYNTFSYYLLFLAIATRLRTRQQLWRLLVVVSATATLAALYGVIQHFDMDPLNLNKGSTRAISTFGNALFAGGYQVVALPISAGLGLTHVIKKKSITVGSIWAIVLAVQVVGLFVTFSRGPLATAVLVTVLFLIFVRIMVGMRVFAVALILFAATTIVGAGVILGPNVLKSVDNSQLFARESTVLGFTETPDEFQESTTNSLEATAETTTPTQPKVTKIIGTSPVAFLDGTSTSAEAAKGSDDAKVVEDSLRLSGTTEANSKPDPDDQNGSVSTQSSIKESVESEDLSSDDEAVKTVQEELNQLASSFRVNDFAEDVKVGSFGGRIPLWKNSFAVITDRPWVDFTSGKSPVISHFIGYGPDMLRYVLPLRWDQASREPVNASAHNQLLQILLEIGIIGFLSFVAFIASHFVVAVHVMLKKRGGISPLTMIIMGALLASLAARLIEQMTGVARVSDSALFWALAGALYALVRMEYSSAEAKVTPTRGVAGFRYWKVGIAVLLAFVGAILIWQKNVPYAQAAALGSQSIASFNRAELIDSLELMDQAIFKAPDEAAYYNVRASLMNSFEAKDEIDEIQIATEQYAYNKLAYNINPLSHVPKAMLSASAMKLFLLGDVSKGEEFVRLLEELVEMLPGYEALHNQMAVAYLNLGRPKEAVAVLNLFAEENQGRRPLTKRFRHVLSLATAELQRVQQTDAPPAN